MLEPRCEGHWQKQGSHWNCGVMLETYRCYYGREGWGEIIKLLPPSSSPKLFLQHLHCLNPTQKMQPPAMQSREGGGKHRSEPETPGQHWRSSPTCLKVIMEGPLAPGGLLETAMDEMDRLRGKVWQKDSVCERKKDKLQQIQVSAFGYEPPTYYLLSFFHMCFIQLIGDISFPCTLEKSLFLLFLWSVFFSLFFLLLQLLFQWSSGKPI